MSENVFPFVFVFLFVAASIQPCYQPSLNSCGIGNGFLNQVDSGEKGFINQPVSLLDSSQEKELIERTYLRTEANGAHCGIYSVAAAIKAVGGNVSVQDLIKNCKISNAEGCSAADIVEMVEFCGYRATVTDKLSGGVLAFSKTPIIIHFDGQRTIENTHHWVCFLGVRNGRPVLFDPPNPSESVNYGDILAYTSGLGIAVSKNELPLNSYWFGKFEILFWVFSCFLSLLVATKLFTFRSSKKTQPSKLSFQFGYLVLAILTMILIQQMLPWATFLRDHVSLGHFQEIYASAIPPEEIEFDRVVDGIREQTINVIDARLPAAFGQGHIPGAINWPVDGSIIESRNAFQRLDLNKPVVVYCESSRCTWSDAISIRLSKRGARDVFIFRGGYREWLARSK